jgi:hypothetical protein
MMTIVDHIFGHCYGVGVRERCSDLLWTVKENLEAFYVMKGVNKRRAALQQQPPFRPIRQDTTASSSDFAQMAMQTQLQTPMDSVDFESLLGGLGSGSTGMGYDDFLVGMPGDDPGAIFVPVDSGVAVQATDWVDGIGTASPSNGIQQQWV